MTDLRTAAQAAIEALRIGRDCAAAEAAQFHASMAGYKPARHAAMDADVAEIEKSIEALRAALAQPEPTPEVDAAIALLHRLLESPTNWITPAWKDAIRPVLVGLITRGQSVNAHPPAQPDTVAVPRELLERVSASLHRGWDEFNMAGAVDELLEKK